MSSYEDDEALFEDIYDDDNEVAKEKSTEKNNENKDAETEAEKQDQKPEAETSAASVPEGSTSSSNQAAATATTSTSVSEDQQQPNLQPPAAASQQADQLQQTQQNQPIGQHPFNSSLSSYTGQPAYPGADPNLHQQYPPVPPPPQPPVQHQPSSMGRETGKMFIGGLNWDTTEEGLVSYFSKFGEVVDYTIMKDNNTGKSRGFGFLTFRDPKSVDEVIKTDHILDGKLIDPKRAIAREEQDKVGKIFVGGIDPMVNEKEFHDFFSQFGSIIDAQLMIDKDSGRSRGFGFITFDSPDAVDRVTVNKFLTLKGKAMEVKRAEPRGQHQQNQMQQQQQQQQYNYNYGNQYGQAYPQMAYGQQQMAPEMVEYWQRMQQWFMFQQQAQGAGGEQKDVEQPGQPLNPQQQANEPEGDPEQNSDRNNENANDDYRGGYDNGQRDQRRMNLPKGPRRAPPSGPSGSRGGRGGYHKRSRGYHPYNRGGRR